MEKTKIAEKDTITCAPRQIMLEAAMLRLDGIDDEVRAGYEIVRRQHKTITMFGSARTPEGHPDYEIARQTAYKLAEDKYSIITGGGHGIMEAANRGAFEAGGTSIGFNITLPHEQKLNEYTTESFAFHHFSPRKIVMTLFADAYLFFPGGFGTFDELCEILTLTQTHKIYRAPIILIDSKDSNFWQPFDEMVRNTLLHEDKVISPGDEKLYTITNSVEEAVALVKANKVYCRH